MAKKRENRTDMMIAEVAINASSLARRPLTLRFSFSAGVCLMLLDKLAHKVLPTLDRSLRSIYPQSFPFRCFQAAVTLDVYLAEQGVDSRVVAGDFEVTTRNSITGHEESHGFGHPESCYSHFWVEAMGRLIDIMPRYIPDGYGGTVLRPPMLMWKMTSPLPNSFRYKVRDPNPPLKRLMGEGDCQIISDLLEDFRRRLKQGMQSIAPRPVLRGPACILAHAQKRDPWCAWSALAHPMPAEPRGPASKIRVSAGPAMPSGPAAAIAVQAKKNRMQHRKR